MYFVKHPKFIKGVVTGAKKGLSENLSFASSLVLQTTFESIKRAFLLFSPQGKTPPFVFVAQGSPSAFHCLLQLLLPITC